MVFHPVRYILKHSGVKEKPWLEINIYERHDSERHFPTELPASQEQTFTAKCSLWHLRQWWMITLAENVVTLNRFSMQMLSSNEKFDMPLGSFEQKLFLLLLTFTF